MPLTSNCCSNGQYCPSGAACVILNGQMTCQCDGSGCEGNIALSTPVPSSSSGFFYPSAPTSIGGGGSRSGSGRSSETDLPSLRSVKESLIRSFAIHFVAAATVGHLMTLRNFAAKRSTTLLHGCIPFIPDVTARSVPSPAPIYNCP